MNAVVQSPNKLSAVGYEALVRDYALTVLPHFRYSMIARSARRTERMGARERHVYPISYTPTSETALHSNLDFALKHDGVNLEILAALFAKTLPEEIANYIVTKPTGQNTRRIWFLYEWLTGRRLELPDATGGKIVPVLDPKRYFVAAPRLSRRHRLQDNLPGVREFCPLIRRTRRLSELIDKKLQQRSRDVVGEFDPEVIQRATDYLYTRETKASYEIERERPDQRKATRFVALLKSTADVTQLDVDQLVRLQNAIVDERYAARHCRVVQNYVGTSRPGMGEFVHYVSPRPHDVEDMMRGLLAALQRMNASDVDPVVQAAAVSFGFVFIHPFDDGNGRIHRYLIHHVLARRGFTPPGIILPVSAVMLAHRREYAACLESFSRELLPLIDYELDDDGIMTVKNDTALHYRYFDATHIAEYLYDVVERTIETDLVEELRYIVRYDEAKHAIQEIVDLPNRQLNLFIRLAGDNNGKLAKKKRKLFAELTDDEIEQLEDVVRTTIVQPEP